MFTVYIYITMHVYTYIMYAILYCTVIHVLEKSCDVWLMKLLFLSNKT